MLSKHSVIDPHSPDLKRCHHSITENGGPGMKAFISGTCCLLIQALGMLASLCHQAYCLGRGLGTAWIKSGCDSTWPYPSREAEAGASLVSISRFQPQPVTQKDPPPQPLSHTHNHTHPQKKGKINSLTWWLVAQLQDLRRWGQERGLKMASSRPVWAMRKCDVS